MAGDEKFISWNWQRAFAAMTVGEESVLGISLAMEAATSALTAAYGTFQHEAQGFDASYAPQTVNTDGWVPTQLAWRALFPLIVLIGCFLHAWLKVRERARRLPEAVATGLHRTIWQAYHCPSTAELTAALEKLRNWAEAELKGTVQEYVLKLCAHADHFAAAYAYPTAHRMSNMIDRHMRPLERWLLGRKAFHGSWRSTELQLRAWAHFHNFGPYCPRAVIGQHFRSPAHRLTGRLYHENWLQNLLVSTSLAGLRSHHKIR